MKKIIAIFILMFIWPCAAHSAGISPDEAAAAISARYQGIDSISASYSRVAATPKTDRLFQNSSSQMATGLLSWARPASLLLDQKSPQPEIMVTDSATVWWYIPSESLVYRYRNLDVAGQLGPLLNFLSGLDSLKADFEISAAPAEKSRPGQTGLILTPKEEGGNVDTITVWCDEAFNLTGFRLSAVTGETTDFFLTSFTLNPELPKNTFTFKVPKGVDVIDDDQQG